MIEKIAFPLKLDSDNCTGTFYTKEPIKLDEQIDIIKKFFPYILEPTHIFFKGKGMTPLVYNYSNYNGGIVCSFLTSLHIIKITLLDDGKLTYTAYNNSDGVRISKYDVIDMVDYININTLDLFYSSVSSKDFPNIMKSMFSIK